MKICNYYHGCPGVNCIATSKDWSEFVRRITFHKSNATKDLEAYVLPTYTALQRHVLRATYVLKLVFSISSNRCVVLNECFNYGWVNGKGDRPVEIDWDDTEVVESFISPFVTCGCKAGCNSKRCKCYRTEATCNIKCRCKNCKNKGTKSCNSSVVANNICTDTLINQHFQQDDDEEETDDGSDSESELEIQLLVD